MIGFVVSGRIDSQLRLIFPASGDSSFGGLSVLLVGDCRHLPLVRDRPIFFWIT